MKKIFLFLLPVFLLSQCAESPLSDEEIMDLVQEQCFQYFWDGAEPVSGLACERIHVDGDYPRNDKSVVTTGGSGFGLMAVLVGIEREFISPEEGLERFEKIVGWLEKADRFHGVYSHWIHGETGKVVPFGRDDDGGDLVETSFLFQGLLCVRQYYMDGSEREKNLAARIDKLWREVEWNWHQGPEQKNVLLWHWSPNFGWQKNHEIRGYNECLITYVMAASSPTYPISQEVYHEGWARKGDMVGGTTKYGYELVLNHNGSIEYGGPLFWSHYPYLGLDPRKLEDQYASYWEHNCHHVLIDYEYCLENPEGFEGYGPSCWGLTASYTLTGYTAHSPGNDKGVISPTAALASMPYTPKESLAALRYFYEELGEKLIGPYGPYDAFSLSEDWFPTRYLAIDQGPIPVMIENYRSGLLWDLFMSCPEVRDGLDKLGFTY